MKVTKKYLSQSDSNWQQDVLVWTILCDFKGEALCIKKVLKHMGFMIDSAYPTSNNLITAVQSLQIKKYNENERAVK